MTRLDVWNKSIQETEFRKPADGDLPLLLARVSRYQKVSKNGVTIEFKNERLRYYCTEARRETWRYIGKEVYVRYDPANLMEARIFDKDTDKYIDTWKLDMDMQVPYITDDKDEIAAAEKTICAVRKSIKEHAKGIKDNITGDQAIDLLKDKDREIAELIGADNLIKLSVKYGGSYVYVPTLSTLKRSEVSEELKQQYNGNNAAELGKKYKLSERTVIRMIMKKST